MPGYRGTGAKLYTLYTAFFFFSLFQAYLIAVTCRDNSRYVIYRRYKDFNEMHSHLEERFPIEAGAISAKDRTLPTLPGVCLSPLSPLLHDSTSCCCWRFSQWNTLSKEHTVDYSPWRVPLLYVHRCNSFNHQFVSPNSKQLAENYEQAVQK